jgi:hypothetical protein
MSNNYSEYRTTIFPSREDRDVWLTQCHIARAGSAKWLSECEGFDPVGDRCLKIWHNGNVNTGHTSKLLQVNNQLTEQCPTYPWLGSHHVEGNEYCFDICVNGVLLSFDDFSIMMSDDNEDSLLQSYECWVRDMQKVFTSDDLTAETHQKCGDRLLETRDYLRADFLHVIKKFNAAQSLVKDAKTDTQLISLYEILVNVMRDVVVAHRRYEAAPEYADEQDELRRVELDSGVKEKLRIAWEASQKK